MTDPPIPPRSRKPGLCLGLRIEVIAIELDRACNEFRPSLKSPERNPKVSIRRAR
ncbi:hypothetical protein KSP39_PZI014063 [Platanthera zijinensis]|uniref:Uncharacterized protein n=1 Tax=Platanthera zijinensis TaxID=2320716 RepID=A0AAP0BES3_9ASPA